MSSENDTYKVEEQVLDFYRSVDISRRTEDEYLLTKAIEDGITPSTIRYGKMRDVYRGAIKDIVGDSYYFTVVQDDFRLVKASDDTKKWEVERMLKNCQIGCDLLKSSAPVEEEEEAEVDKAEGGGGGEGGGAPVATMQEEDAIAAQDDLITDQHPGGTGGQTPDLEYRGRNWHPDDPEAQQPPPEVQKAQAWDFKTLLSGLGDMMAKGEAGAPTARPYVTEREKQFMVDELGRTPQEVSMGNTSLNPTQRKLYNMWVNKGLRKSLSSLEDWKSRNG